MARYAFFLLALVVSVPAIARHDEDEKERKRPVFKLMLDVPVEAPAETTFNPSSFGLNLPVEDGFRDFLDTFIVNPEHIVINPPHPFIEEFIEDLGTAHGFGEASRYRRGDTVYLGSGQWARSKQQGIPFGVAIDFLPKGNTWVSLGWQMSKETVIDQFGWRDTLRVENIDTQWIPSLGTNHFFVDVSRHRHRIESRYKLRSFYYSASVKQDLFPRFQYASLMPTAGARLWSLRESVHRETWDQRFEGSFYPERRNQSAEDTLGPRHNVERTETVRYQNTVQFFAGLSGEVYPWGKGGVFGIGARAVYLFNQRDVESPYWRFNFTSPGWQLSAQAILAF